LYRFWHFAGEYITNERKFDPTIWTGCIHLYSQLLKIEKKARKNLGGNIELSKEDLDNFLLDELKL